MNAIHKKKPLINLHQATAVRVVACVQLNQQALNGNVVHDL